MPTVPPGGFAQGALVDPCGCRAVVGPELDLLREAANLRVNLLKFNALCASKWH